jgi:hypothetical protein
MLHNEDLDQKFERMKTEYEAALEYFETYKNLIQQYPIPYNQELVIGDIDVYRLDGISAEINFLRDEIPIWNYAQWVENTRKDLSDYVDQLRKDMITEDIRVEEVLANIERDYGSDDFEYLDISKELLFTIRKYDLQSVVEPLFLFKEAKHELRYQKMSSNELDTSSSIETGRKLFLYGQMINRIADSDSILSDIEKRNTIYNYTKYKSFLDERFDGMGGVTEFVGAERNSNTSDFDQYVTSIRDMIFESMGGDTTNQSTNYRRMEIPLNVEYPLDKVDLTSEHVTTHRVINLDSSSFVGGIKLNESEGLIQVYVAGVTAEGQVGWYNEYMLQIDSAVNDADTRIGAMQAVPGGIALVLNGLNPETEESINHLILLNESGEEQINKRLFITEFPRGITYSDRNNTLLVAFKGADYNPDIFISNELIVANYNILGDLQWQQRIENKGDFVDAAIISDGYIIAGNYNLIRGLDNRLIQAGRNNEDTRVYLWKLGFDGSVLDLKTIDGNRNYFANNLYKISDNCINIFGSQGTYSRGLKMDTGPNYIHLIVNRKLEILSNSL